LEKYSIVLATIFSLCNVVSVSISVSVTVSAQSIGQFGFWFRSHTNHELWVKIKMSEHSYITALLDEQLYGPHGYDFDMRPFRNPDPRGDPRIDPRMLDPRLDPRADPRIDSRPPPSYAVAVRSSRQCPTAPGSSASRPCPASAGPSASATSATATSDSGNASPRHHHHHR
jgi:hypothetical protein